MYICIYLKRSCICVVICVVLYVCSNLRHILRESASPRIRSGASPAPKSSSWSGFPKTTPRPLSSPRSRAPRFASTTARSLRVTLSKLRKLPWRASGPRSPSFSCGAGPPRYAWSGGAARGMTGLPPCGGRGRRSAWGAPAGRCVCCRRRS